MCPIHRRAQGEDLKKENLQGDNSHKGISVSIEKVFWQKKVLQKTAWIEAILCKCVETKTGFVVTLLISPVNQSGVTFKPEKVC